MFFWVECLAQHESGLSLGSTLVPIFSSMLSPGMLVPCFPFSMENKDLG
jgi:hypothetical protein